MKLPIVAVIALSCVPFAKAQVSQNNLSSSGLLSPGTTLPIAFEHGVDANHVHTGDAISAKTAQMVHLANGQVLPAGSHVAGHVVTASGYAFDRTPYARQPQSTLAIQFDSVESKGTTIPLHVYVRAMADPLTLWDAQRPKASDMDSLGTTTQIGGDQVTPSQKEVLSQDGDIVGYQKRGGIYAHLISASGNGPGGCDASDTEQSMGQFSAAACGLYGYTDVSLLGTGKSGETSTMTLVARRHAAKIWAKSPALLEVVGDQSGVVSQ